MRQSVNMIKRLLDECGEQDRSAWHSDAQTILGAIHKSHPTRRGVQIAIAAAFFEKSVLPGIATAGWKLCSEARQHDHLAPAIRKDKVTVRILISTLQAADRKVRRRFALNDDGTHYIAQLRKTRNRTRENADTDPASKSGLQGPVGTQAWSFDEFDILAVNTYPVTRQWTQFRYTLSRTLLPSADHPGLIATLQPVELESSKNWSSDLGRCVGRFLSSHRDSPAGAR